MQYGQYGKHNDYHYISDILEIVHIIMIYIWLLLVPICDIPATFLFNPNYQLVVDSTAVKSGDAVDVSM